MIRWILGQIRGRWGRSIALFAGVLIATTGFTVLTGSSVRSRLMTTGVVNQNFRAAYDILVRPPGSKTPTEQAKGLVRPNYLSGLFGGITLEQYARIRDIAGVEIAAPIAMIGYTTADVRNPVDVTDAVDRARGTQLLRLRPTWSAERGLTTLSDDAARYVYVTRRPIIWPQLTGSGHGGYSDGHAHTAEAAACGNTAIAPPLEVQEDGHVKAVCASGQVHTGTTGLDQRDRAQIVVTRLLPGGAFDRGPTFPSGQHLVSDRLTIDLPWPMSLLLAAIDPFQESRLVGLDSAMVSGALPSPQLPTADLPKDSIPVVAPAVPGLDEQLTIRVDRLGANAVTGVSRDRLLRTLDSAGGARVQDRKATATDVYAKQIRDELRAQLQVLIQSGPTRYESAQDGSLTAVAAPVNRDAVWGNLSVSGLPVSWFARDRALRALSREASPAQQRDSGLAWAVTVGVFDPRLLRGYSELSAVPLETYHAPPTVGADDRSRALLGDRPLEPNSNPGGYLATPPMMLTSLDLLPNLLANSPRLKAPISAIRVRVAGIHGLDALSQERVRSVAEKVATATGLDVDITVGASPAPQIVNLPAGLYGRPQLRLREGWSEKGVAVALIRAIDRKSLVLLVLIVIVCVLFLVNAVSASVRDRRRELAVLACLGWPPHRLFAAVVGEVAVVGAAAGLAAAALAIPLSSVVGVDGAWWKTLLAVPAAVAISMLAATVPAVGAARTYPGAAIHPVVAGPRQAGIGRRGRTIAGLAFANMARTPGRALLAATALATAAAGATILGLILTRFHGTVIGTLMGDAVSVQVRGTDLIAMGSIVLLGVACVGDVLYINIRERASEIAALRAAGWSDGAVTRLIGYEGLGIGVLGSVAGTIGGQMAMALFLGAAPSPAQALLGALATICSAIILTGVSAGLVALTVGRTSIAAILAED